MSEDKNLGLFTITKPVVMAFPHLFKPVKFKDKQGRESGEEKFSANFVIPSDHPDLSGMKAIAAKVAKARWPGVDLKTLAFPFQSGTAQADKRKAAGKEDGEYTRGCAVIAARSKYEPRLSGTENGKIVDYDLKSAELSKKFFPGAEVLGQINFVAYEGVGRNPNGVTAYLNMVYSTGKGTKLSGTGGASAAETFKGYAGTVTEENPLEGTAPDESGLGPDTY